MITIYTVITDNYVNLMPQEYLPNFRYVCFTDGSFQAPDPWQTIVINESFDNPTILSRVPKILSHKYFNEGDITVYFDGKEKLDNAKIISAINLTNQYDFISLRHPWRETYCDEMIWMYVNGLITSSEVKNKTMQLVKDAYLFLNHICTLNHCIIRKQSEYTKRFETRWWDEYKKFKCHTKRDQLPFSIALQKMVSDKHFLLDRGTCLDTGDYAIRNGDLTIKDRPSIQDIAEMQSYLTCKTKTPLIGQLLLSKPLSV